MLVRQIKTFRTNFIIKPIGTVLEFVLLTAADNITHKIWKYTGKHSVNTKTWTGVNTVQTRCVFLQTFVSL